MSLAPVDPHRPSPDALLEQAKREGRGRLKIFLGAAPGVGKTYEMLAEARQRLRDGVDVVVGVVETHGRTETEALTAGFETVPRLHIPYKGRTLQEMDIDAVLKRRPKLVLVDELAHTNAHGSRHPKRYLDVEELLAAGIDVFTTLNIQHVESLNDVVAQITRIRVRETVPDRIVDQADEVKAVDLTPEGLIKRLNEGKVYVRAQAERALRHYFSPGNLTALRELALRKVAQRVDQQMIGYMKANAIGGPWAAAERVLVCINEHTSAAEVVRRARRLAADLKAGWIALYVEGPRHRMLSEAARDRIAETMRLAQHLGAEAVTLPGRDIVETVIAYARENNVTQIVVGKSERSRFFELLNGSVVHELLRESGPIGVHVVSAPGADLPTASIRTRPARVPISLAAYGWSAAAVAVTLGAAMVLDLALNLETLSMVFLVPVLYAAVTFGLRPALASTILSVLSYNFFLVPPLYTFTISNPNNALALLVLLLVAVATSNLTARVRAQADMAAERARVAGELYSFAGKIAAIARLDDILWASAFQIASMLKASVVILLPDAFSARLVVRAGYPPEDQLDDADLAAAQWSWTSAKAAGRNSDTLPGARRLFLPMRAGEELVGVVGLLRPDDRAMLTHDERRLLDALLDLTALSIERSRLAERVEDAKVRDEADKLRVAMLTSLSHDLRTPLASILGAASSLRAYGAMYDAGKQQELAVTIEEESRRLDRFVGNLLDMSRLEAGVVGVKHETIDVAEAVDEAVQKTSKHLFRHRVLRNIPRELPAITGDRILLEQALFNLLDNAAKYAPESSPIRIGAVPDSGSVVISIIDEGPGIPPADLSRIFDKFYRAASADRRIAGTGLGLAVARGFVEAMGGTLTAGNRLDGTGAIFRIALPAVEEAPAHAR